VLLDTEALCCFYAHNDILIRRGEPPHGVALPPLDAINRSRTYLQVDGQPHLDGLVDSLPQVFVYSESAFYYMLHLGHALTPHAAARPPLQTTEVYHVAEGEAPRRLTLLRRRWPNEPTNDRPTTADGRPAGWAEAEPGGRARLRARNAASARARCGSAGSTAGSSSLPPPVSEHATSSREGDESRDLMRPSVWEQTRRALHVAAAIREDAGKCWPGGVPVNSHAMTPARVDADTLHALLGFPEDALEA
jgi:hypothetical protein